MQRWMRLKRQFWTKCKLDRPKLTAVRCRIRNERLFCCPLPGYFINLKTGADAAQCLLTILYPVYNLFYYHEGHEDDKGKRQCDLSNEVIGCAIEELQTRKMFGL